MPPPCRCLSSQTVKIASINRHSGRSKPRGRCSWENIFTCSFRQIHICSPGLFISLEVFILSNATTTTTTTSHAFFQREKVEQLYIFAVIFYRRRRLTRLLAATATAAAASPSVTVFVCSCRHSTQLAEYNEGAALLLFFMHKERGGMCAREKRT